MKKVLAFLMILCSQGGYSQPDKARPQVKRVCMEMEIVNAKTNINYKVAIHNRKIIASKTASGIQTGKKVIKIDKKLFERFRQSIFNKTNIYGLPDVINCSRCEEGTRLTLHVKTKSGIKNISGSDPQEVNAEIKYILDYISRLVGTIDDDFVKE